MKNRIIAAAGGLFLAAATFLAGCGKADGSKTAFSVNDHALSMGTAVFFLRSNQASTASIMSAYGYGNGGMWDTQTGTNSSSEPVSYGEDFKKSIQDAMIKDMLLREHAEEYKVTLPEELQDEMQKAASSLYADNPASMEQNGIQEENIREALELLTWSNLLYEPMTADVDTNVSEEESAMSTLTYARVNFQTYDEKGQPKELTEAEKKDKKDHLEILLQQVQKSKNPAEADITSMAAAVDSDIMVSSSSYNKESTNLPEAVYKEARSLADGEISGEILDTGDACYLIRQDKKLDPDATASKKESIISQRKTEAYEAKLDEWQKAAKISIEKAWEKVKVTDRNPFVAKQAEKQNESVNTESSRSVSTSTSSN